jgi:hypothetical protein
VAFLFFDKAALSAGGVFASGFGDYFGLATVIPSSLRRIASLM